MVDRFVIGIGRWVIIAPDRAKRPEHFKQDFTLDPNAFCPFCEGNEDATPPEIMAYRQPSGFAPNWPISGVMMKPMMAPVARTRP